MNAKGMIFFTTVMATTIGLFGTPQKAAAVNSGITVDTTYTVGVKVNPPPMGPTYTITVTGTVTLGTLDSWGGLSITLLEPNNTIDSPTITYTVPARGATTAWSAVYVTQTGGKGWWTAAAFNFFTGMNSHSVNANPNLMFNVPPP